MNQSVQHNWLVNCPDEVLAGLQKGDPNDRYEVDEFVLEVKFPIL